MDQTSIESNCMTLQEILLHHAHDRPDEIAFVYLENGEIEQPLTYGQLDLAARDVAQRLQANAVNRQDRVVLLFPSGLSFLCAYMGCLYAGAVPVPAYPPARNAHALEGVLTDCTPSLVLGCPAILERIHAKFGESDILRQARWQPYAYSVDGIQTTLHEQPVAAKMDDLAMLQYTSGSTGSPKGVMLTYANLAANLKAITQRFGLARDRIMVSWLPLYHDMGLIGAVLGSLYAGQKLYFMSPQDFVQEPYKWLRAISKYKAFISGAPNFAYRLCIERITPAQIKELDLSGWKVAFNGAEPIRSTVLDQFSEKFYFSRFDRSALQPCYGMAEASLLISSCPIGDIPLVRHVSKPALESHQIKAISRQSKDCVSIVSCGFMIDGHHPLIVNPETLVPCAPNQVGEIWVSGPSMTRGYWNKPEMAERTQAVPVGHTDERSYFRTGDLGFISDEHLFITGRCKDLIIIRGRNYYPQDLELTATESHPALRPDGNAAFDIDTPDGSKLVIVQEVVRTKLDTFDAEAAAAAVKRAVSSKFQLDVHAMVFIGPQQLSKTSSGKVQRSKMKALYLSGKLPTIAVIKDDEAGHARRESQDAGTVEAASPLEQQLRAMVAAIIKVHPSVVKLELALVEQGIDSLKQLELSHQIAKTFGHTFTVEAFFDGLSLRKMAAELTAVGLSATPAETPVNIKTIVDNTHAKVVRTPTVSSPVEFSMMFFSSDAQGRQKNRYDLLMSSTDFGDKNGFTAVWLPERHFHRFGGLYPNPAVLGATLANRTSNIRIRAGSVIIPLHDPLRVAEEWSIVDNLSNGRVDLAFGQGWNPNDFVLAPERYADRLQTMYRSIETVEKLWKGEKISRQNGLGEQADVSIFPPPVQSSVNVWITCSGGEERFAEAGAIGANVLTALLFQDIAELDKKLRAYRLAREWHGHDPMSGHVTLMLHTFIGEDLETVRSRVREPMLKYLEDSVDLWRQKSDQLDSLDAAQKAQVLEFAFQRYVRSQSLCGTPESCLPFVQQLSSIGVNEIACLLDFGVPAESVMASLWSLKRLKDNAAANLSADQTITSKAG